MGNKNVDQITPRGQTSHSRAQTTRQNCFKDSVKSFCDNRLFIILYGSLFTHVFAPDGLVIRATFFFNFSRNIVALQVETHCCVYCHVCDQLVSQQNTVLQVCRILPIQSCVIENGSLFHII